MNAARIVRNKKMRDEYKQRRHQGECSSDIFDDLAQRHCLSFDTVKNIITDGKYETRYLNKKKQIT